MNKKTFTILLVICFIAIAGFHFTLNFNRRNQPPSSTWSKEVLISSGNVQSNPSLIEFKDNYIVAHIDGNKINILSVDKLGKKINEKQFSAKGEVPLSTNVVTDGKELNLFWTISAAGKKTLYNVRLDDKFNILEEKSFQDISEVIQIDESTIAISYKDKIVVNDFSIGKNYSVPADDINFLSGARNKEGYIISFKQQSGEVKYFTIKNGETSSVKTAGKIENFTRVYYISSTMLADDNFVYLLMEYRNDGEFGGTKEFKFSLKDEGKFEFDDFKINNSKIEILGISPYYEGDSASFLARINDEVVEYNLTNGGQPVPVTRTKELSMFPAGKNDQAIFCDVVGKDKFNVYMTSKNEEFKKIHNNLRMYDFKLALLDSLTGLLISFAYILPYGALWVIPTVGIIAIYSILEYNLTQRKKKIGFSLIYLSFFIFKSIGIHFVSFKRFGAFMPKFMSFELSLSISLVISLLCGIYAFSKYSKDIEYNIGAMSILMPLVYDTILSLMVVVPFIV